MIKRSLVILALLTTGLGVWLGGRASASVPQTCPRGDVCKVVITDIGNAPNGLGDALTVQDYLRNPMMGVDIFQLYSSNPVCALASSTNRAINLQPRACLGGTPPLNATGGYPVLSLWDGHKWQILTARDIIRMHNRGM